MMIVLAIPQALDGLALFLFCLTLAGSSSGIAWIQARKIFAHPDEQTGAEIKSGH